MSLTVGVDDVSRDEWVRLAAGFADHNFCQCWDYGRLRAEDTGSESSHAVVRRGGDVLAMAECRVKRVPMVRWGLAYVSGGPLLAPRCGARREDAVAALRMLRRAYVEERGFVLRLLPRPRADREANADGLFCEAGFAEAVETAPERTLLLDLSPDLPDLRRGFEQKWRNCLNVAERQGLQVQAGVDDRFFEAFDALYGELVERKEFRAPLGSAFYRRLQRGLPDEERLLVSIAFADGVPVAGHVASLLGDTCVYLLGASNDEGRRTRAAYLLQWHVLQEAKRRGLRWYDLGGIDPDRNPGVYHFKRGLGGVEVVAPGPFTAGSWARCALIRTAQHFYRTVHT